MYKMQSLLEENELTCAVALILIPGSPTYCVGKSQNRMSEVALKQNKTKN